MRRSKLEQWLENQIRSQHPNVALECNSRSAIELELDFYFPDLKMAFEVNGIFHTKAIYGESKLSKVRNLDSLKCQRCLEKGIDLCVLDISHLTHVKPEHANSILELIMQKLRRGQDSNLQGL